MSGPNMLTFMCTHWKRCDMVLREKCQSSQICGTRRIVRYRRHKQNFGLDNFKKLCRIHVWKRAVECFISLANILYRRDSKIEYISIWKIPSEVTCINLLNFKNIFFSSHFHLLCVDLQCNLFVCWSDCLCAQTFTDLCWSIGHPCLYFWFFLNLISSAYRVYLHHVGDTESCTTLLLPWFIDWRFFFVHQKKWTFVHYFRFWPCVHLFLFRLFQPKYFLFFWSLFSNSFPNSSDPFKKPKVFISLLFG